MRAHLLFNRRRRKRVTLGFQLGSAFGGALLKALGKLYIPIGDLYKANAVDGIEDLGTAR
jgi:hypothetical protein